VLILRTLVAVLLGVAVTASIADAGNLERGSIIPKSGSIIPRVGPIVPHGPNIVPNPPPDRMTRPVFPRHGFRPGVIFVSPPPVVVYAAPRECVSPGYWAYQWIPTSYTQSAWVPGGWTADGAWIESRYEQQAYASGYYQSYWVPAQPYAC
jgi:hypothetical protein